MTEAEQRQAVIAEARAWLRTPWHHEARVKGGGVDCANFLIGVYAACGLIEEFTPDHYPPDFMLHREEPRFVNYLLQYAERIDGPPMPADIAMFRYGHSDSHGAIVYDWPQVIHAHRPERGVVITTITGSPLEQRIAGFYRLKVWL